MVKIQCQTHNSSQPAPRQSQNKLTRLTAERVLVQWAITEQHTVSVHIHTTYSRSSHPVDEHVIFTSVSSLKSTPRDFKYKYQWTAQMCKWSWTHTAETELNKDIVQEWFIIKTWFELTQQTNQVPDQCSVVARWCHMQMFWREKQRAPLIETHTCVTYNRRNRVATLCIELKEHRKGWISSWYHIAMTIALWPSRCLPRPYAAKWGSCDASSNPREVDPNQEW